MAEIAPKPERVSIWIPKNETLLGSELPDWYRKDAKPPTFDELVGKFDKLKEGALTQHIGRVAQVGQSLELKKSYQPYITDRPEMEIEVPTLLEVTAQWKNPTEKYEPVLHSVYSRAYQPEQELAKMAYIMNVLEGAIIERQATFTGRV
ncbi:MAG: hypothetical protein AAB436_00350 [Patescibacteria group bacterium]